MGGAELGKMAMRAGNGRGNVERGLGKIAETAGSRGAGKAVFRGKPDYGDGFAPWLPEENPQRAYLQTDRRHDFK